MNRERKLLYVVAILAPILEMLMFVAWFQRDIPARGALIEQLHACQERLIRSWAECRPTPPDRGYI